MSEQPFNLPALTMPPELPIILRLNLLPLLRSDSPGPVRRNHLDPLVSQLSVERVTIISSVPYKSLRGPLDMSRSDSRYYKLDFIRASSFKVEGDASTCSNCAMILLPSPRLVLPTQGPPFWC